MIRATLTAAALTPLVFALCAWLPPTAIQAQAFPQVQPSVSVGVLDGPSALTFGWIEDVEVDEEGRIYVLDRQARDVRWFHQDGRYGGTLGRQGQGPGELSDPRALSTGPAGLIHVLDVGNARISTYDISGPSPIFQSAMRTEGIGDDICFLGTRRFVLQLHGTGGIDELGDDGHVIARLASFEAPSPGMLEDAGPGGEYAVRVLTNQGSIVCDGKAGVIYHVPENSPVIRAYTPDGKLLWRTELKDYNRVKLAALKGPCCAYFPNDEAGTSHQTISLAPLTDGRAVVSVIEMDQQKDPTEWPMSTRILDGQTGAELARLLARARIMKVQRGRTYGYLQYPYPRVVVY